MILGLVDQLLIGKDLERNKVNDLFQFLFSHSEECERTGKLILLLLRKKGEHVNEILGLIDAIRKIEPPLKLKNSSAFIDSCGTGGDGAQTFNISTIASFVAAGGGAQLAKHGNRSISSRAGSSDLLESLGVKIDAPKNQMLFSLKHNHFGYFHAPLYHTSFKSFQPMRKELASKKIKTVFNIIGPLVNPIRISKQTIGVFSKDLVYVIAKALQQLKYKHALVFWNYDGLDELTTISPTLVAEVRKNKIRSYIFRPNRFKFKKGVVGDLKGGNVNLNRKIALQILHGRDQSIRFDTVILNAAVILYTAGQVKNFAEGIQLARKSITNKSALNVLQQVKKASYGTR